MRWPLLELLRCPFCGGRLQVCEAPAPVRDDAALTSGVLGCECAAYPVVDGIPFLQTGQAARLALHHLERRDAVQARQALVSGAAERPGRADAEPATFREGLAWWCPGAEADYLLHRFSDPTFRVMEWVLPALARDMTRPAPWILDVCGGGGHLARLLGRLDAPGEDVGAGAEAGTSEGGVDHTKEGLPEGRTTSRFRHRGARVVVADRDYARLWLARRFVAPESEMVCCDAAQALPFQPAAFGWVLCADGLNYIWPRRLLVSEMTRAAAPDGVVMVFHMHNALCENPSAGLPLSPATFRSLFEPWPVRLYGESAWLAAALRGGEVDLGRDWSDEELRAEAAMCAVATWRRDLYRNHRPAREVAWTGRLSINPLYQVLEEDGGLRLARRFPSAYYEEEFHAMKDYLPEEVGLSAEEARAHRAGEEFARRIKLAQQRVLLDLPESYA